MGDSKETRTGAEYDGLKVGGNFVSPSMASKHLEETNPQAAEPGVYHCAS